MSGDAAWQQTLDRPCRVIDELPDDRLQELNSADTEFSGHLTRLLELMQIEANPDPGIAREQESLLDDLVTTLRPLKQVGAIGYQRDARGTLLVCVLVNSRELEPEREVIEELIKVRSGNPTVWFDFTTLLSPPSLPEDMIASGFEPLPVKSEAKD